MTTQDKKLAAALHDLGLLGDTLIKRDKDVKALRTRLAEAEGHIRQVLEDAEWYYQRSAERTTGSTCLSFEQARAFLEGSQEVSE